VLVSMRDAWDGQAANWTSWVRTPGHDSYEQFHGARFFELVPPPGRLTIDLGAGEGRVARDLRARGHVVVELEGSAGLARASFEMSRDLVVNGDAARLPFAARVADVAVAFMSLQDVDDMRAAISEAARVLVPGGNLVLAIVHPMNSVGRFSPSEPGQDPLDRPFVIRDSYFAHRRYGDDVVRDGLPMRFESEHRPLESYSHALEDAGFAIEAIREVGDPNPADKWSKMPLFLDLRARLLGAPDREPASASSARPHNASQEGVNGGDGGALSRV
jgi:SAM-dependent methyltransferase